MKQKNIARWRAVGIAKPYTAKLVKLWVAVGAMIIELSECFKSNSWEEKKEEVPAQVQASMKEAPAFCFDNFDTTYPHKNFTIPNTHEKIR